MTQNYKDFVLDKWFSSDEEEMSIAIAVIGMMGETAEFNEKLGEYMDAINRVPGRDLALELGDALFYVTYILDYCGYDIEEVLGLTFDSTKLVRLGDMNVRYAMLRCGGLISAHLGLVAEQFKKLLRGDTKPLADRKELIVEQVRLALFYTAYMGARIGYPIQEMMVMNMHKLNSRHERGEQRGDGDNR